MNYDTIYVIWWLYDLFSFMNFLARHTVWK